MFSPMLMRTRNVAFQEGNKVQIPAVGPQTDLSHWKIRKVLAEPDVALNRMFKFTRAEAEHVLCSIGSDKVEKAREGEDLRVKMVDLDTGSRHELSFRKVRRGSVFGFKLGWVTHFVVRRRLKVGDQIGMYVDPSSSMFRKLDLVPSCFKQFWAHASVGM